MYFNNQLILSADVKKLEPIVPWVGHQDSLTDKLKKSKGSVELKLISQKWVQPTWWDSFSLKIKDKLLFEREIIMSSQNIDYWYARTIIPQKCFDLDPIFFQRLKNESIRNLIFTGDIVQRVQMIDYPINNQCIEYYWIKKHINTFEDSFWVRLAEFSVHQSESFYLMEILLPELENVS